MEELEEIGSYSPPIWAIFGDLMSGLLGVFVLLLVWTLCFQADLVQSLQDEIHKRKIEEQRRMALEKALADPLAKGRVTFSDGKIGISGSFLFSLNSAKLQKEGRELLQSLVKPLYVYLQESDRILMVSGFTDNLVIHEDNYEFDDNWDLSAQRALTVTRALIEDGLSPELIFAAAFGEHQPIASNQDASGRSKNRRVEIAPVPKIKAKQTTDG